MNQSTSPNGAQTAAERTLQHLGYTYTEGAQMWKPPIGKAPDFDLIDGLRARIAELEAKAQGVPWPKDAKDVRDFFHADFISAQFPAEGQAPCDEDRYTITAHDFLSAVNFWADFPHVPRPSTSSTKWLHPGGQERAAGCLNALRRDAAEGKAVRGEMADELESGRATVAVPCGYVKTGGDAHAPAFLWPQQSPESNKGATYAAVRFIDQGEQSMPAFSHTALQKLASLQERGYSITGFAIEKPVEGAQPDRGFINHGGFVGWWRDGDNVPSPAVPAPQAALAAVPDGWKLAPIKVPDSAFAWVSGGYPAGYKAGDKRDTAVVHERAQRTWEAILNGIPTPAHPAEGVPAAAPDARDAAFEAVRNRLCGLQRYSFVLDDDGAVRRVQDRTGNWIEFDDAHELFDPVSVDAAIAAQAGKGVITCA